MMVYIVSLLIILIAAASTATSSPKLAKISTLMDLTVAFDLGDLDDDGFLEYSETRDNFLRVDTNGDEVVSETEVGSDSVGEDVPSVAFKFIDVNGDGKITMDDIDIFFFQLGREYGDEIDLEEHLEYDLSNLVSEESGITVKAFVRARRNYLVMDIDDNLKVSEKEFRSEFRVADYDKNGNLTPKEFNGFRPIRNVNVTAYCNNGNAGCPVDNFLILFNEADDDNNTFLSMTEYLKTFGELTTSK